MNLADLPIGGAGCTEPKPYLVAMADSVSRSGANDRGQKNYELAIVIEFLGYTK